jgi:hypothetical protein
MAKASKKDSAGVNIQLLTAIGGGQVSYISQADALPLINHNPALIEVNTAPEAIVEGKAPVRLSEAGVAYVAANVPAVAGNGSDTAKYQVIDGVVLPPSKRGGGRGGAPVQYPFDGLEVGQSFFVPVSAKHPNPVKTLGSTVSSANMRFSVETGEMKTVERTKRGKKNKAELDAQGNKIKETVTVAVRKQTRKFTIRAIEAGKVYGTWTAEYNGALIQRTQ